jgi:hypothetical protein
VGAVVGVREVGHGRRAGGRDGRRQSIGNGRMRRNDPGQGQVLRLPQGAHRVHRVRVEDVGVTVGDESRRRHRCRHHNKRRWAGRGGGREWGEVVGREGRWRKWVWKREDQVRREGKRRRELMIERWDNVGEEMIS